MKKLLPVCMFHCLLLFNVSSICSVDYPDLENSRQKLHANPVYSLHPHMSFEEARLRHWAGDAKYAAGEADEVFTTEQTRLHWADEAEYAADEVDGLFGWKQTRLRADAAGAEPGFFLKTGPRDPTKKELEEEKEVALRWSVVKRRLAAQQAAKELAAQQAAQELAASANNTSSPLCLIPVVVKPIMNAIPYILSEAAVEAILRRNFSKSISAVVDNSLLDGDDVAAVSSTAMICVASHILTKKNQTEVKIPNFSKDLTTHIIGKYIGRKLVTTSIYVVNRCHRTLRDGDLIDTRKHQDSIKRVQYLAGLIGSATSNVIITNVVNSFSSENNNKSKIGKP